MLSNWCCYFAFAFNLLEIYFFEWTSKMAEIKTEYCDEEESDSETNSAEEINLTETLDSQIAECEMLQSMFPNPNEFFVNQGTLVDVRDYVSGKTRRKPPRLNPIITLDVSDLKLEINVELPSEYPHSKPEVFVRSQKFTKDQQKSLNKSLTNFVVNFEKNEIILGSIISWLQENALDYLKNHNQESNCDLLLKPEKNFTFTRIWIYSHHIFSKFKRKKMIDLANNYLITGFLIPGKPGIICIEGEKSDCEEWWAQVKDMSWQKIALVHKEEFDEMTSLDECRKFSTFQETFCHSAKRKKQDRHMDFGEFYKFLKEIQCEYIFKIYFGFEGK